MRLKVSSAKWRQFCLGLNVLMAKLVSNGRCPLSCHLMEGSLYGTFDTFTQLQKEIGWYVGMAPSIAFHVIFFLYLNCNVFSTGPFHSTHCSASLGCTKCIKSNHHYQTILYFHIARSSVWLNVIVEKINKDIVLPWYFTFNLSWFANFILIPSLFILIS